MIPALPRTRSLALAAALFTLALTACDRAALPSDASVALPGARMDLQDNCLPSVTGPGTTSPNTSSTYTFTFLAPCQLQSIAWSVTFDATITGVTEVFKTTPSSGGTATVLAGQCDHTVSALVTFAGRAPRTYSRSVSVGFDCYAPPFSVSAGGVSAGVAVSWSNVGPASYDVYRRLTPLATGIAGPWELRTTTTGATWTDVQYRVPAPPTPTQFTNEYRVVARRVNAVDVEHTTSLQTRPNTWDE